jgi:hypothetical protein
LPEGAKQRPALLTRQHATQSAGCAGGRPRRVRRVRRGAARAGAACFGTRRPGRRACARRDGRRTGRMPTVRKKSRK